MNFEEQTENGVYRIILESKKGQKALVSLLSKERGLITSLLMCLGISKTELQGFLFLVNTGKCHADICEFIDLPFDADLRMDDPKLINFLLTANKKLPQFSGEVPIISRCDIEIIRRMQKWPKDAISRHIDHSLSGRRAAQKGYKNESRVNKALNLFGVRFETNKPITPEGKTWDQVLCDVKMATEISGIDSSSSNVSNKKNAMLSDNEKRNDLEFVFVGGGMGWESRSSDYRAIMEKFDHVFPLSIDGVTDYVELVLNRLERPSSRTSIKKAIAKVWK